MIPSLPGYGFSTPVCEPGGGNLFRVAQAWAQLMARLGREQLRDHHMTVFPTLGRCLPRAGMEATGGSHGEYRGCLAARNKPKQNLTNAYGHEPVPLLLSCLQRPGGWLAPR